MRIENTRNTRHGQQERIRLHQTRFDLRFHRVTATAELILVIRTEEPVMALHERHRITAITLTDQTISPIVAIIPACEFINHIPFHTEIQTHDVILG